MDFFCRFRWKVNSIDMVYLVPIGEFIFARANLLRFYPDGEPNRLVLDNGNIDGVMYRS